MESLGKLRFYGIVITLRTEKPMVMQFHGNHLRGVLGQALIDAFCPFDELQCLSCDRSHTCPVPQVFKPELIHSQRLPPFVIHRWTLDSSQHEMTFTLILMDAILHFALDWLVALHGYRGNFGAFGAFELVHIEDLQSKGVIYDGQFLKQIPLTPVQVFPQHGETVIVKIVDAFVTKHNEADVFLHALRSRIQRLINEYGDGTRLDYQEPCWQIAKNELRFVVKPIDERRKVRGWRGELVLEALTPLGRQLLALGQYLHAGAQTTVGLGGFSVRAQTKSHRQSPLR